MAIRHSRRLENSWASRQNDAGEHRRAVTFEQPKFFLHEKALERNDRADCERPALFFVASEKAVHVSFKHNRSHMKLEDADLSPDLNHSTCVELGPNCRILRRKC